MVKSRLSPVTVLYLSPERYFIHVKKIFEAAGAEVQKQTVLSVLLQGLLLSKLDCFSNEFQTVWKVATTTVTTAAKQQQQQQKQQATTTTTTATNGKFQVFNKSYSAGIQRWQNFYFLHFLEIKKILKPKK